MKQASQRDLRLLTEIAQREDVTQRALAQSLGIALGLTNLYLKRLARKGYIKIRTIPSNRLRYLLTPKGIAEKSRLTYEYLSFSLILYRETREALRASLHPLVLRGLKRFALSGPGEAAELAYLTLREMGLEPVAIFGERTPDTFLGLPVRPIEEIRDEDIDAVIVSTFEFKGQPRETKTRARDVLLKLGLPGEKLIFLGRAAHS